MESSPCEGEESICSTGVFSARVNTDYRGCHSSLPGVPLKQGQDEALTLGSRLEQQTRVKRNRRSGKNIHLSSASLLLLLARPIVVKPLSIPGVPYLSEKRLPLSTS